MEYSRGNGGSDLPPLVSRSRVVDMIAEFSLDHEQETQDLHTKLDRAHDTIAELREELRRQKAFTSAFDSLFDEFIRYLDTSTYISLDLEAKAFLSTIADTLSTGVNAADKENGWARHVKESLGDPDAQKRILLGIQALQADAAEKAKDQATELAIMDAHRDIQVQQPQLEKRIYDEFRQSPEGLEVYDDAYNARILELGLADPKALAERVKHQAFLDADKAWLDACAHERRITNEIQEAAAQFDSRGIDISRLPQGTEVTIWLGSEAHLHVLQGKSSYPGSTKKGVKSFFGIGEVERPHPPIYYERKIVGVVMDDAHDGLMIRADSLATSSYSYDENMSYQDTKREYSVSSFLDKFSDEPKRKKGKKSHKPPHVQNDDYSPLRNAHAIGHTYRGYRSEVPELHTRLIAGLPLAFDDDPTDAQFKQTSALVVNAAINRIPIYPFSDEHNIND